MSLAAYYFHQFTLLQYLDFAFRLVLAFFIGGTVGLERSKHFKEAGVRTHILVCITATLIMLISKYGFADLNGTAAMNQYGVKGADTARVAAQAVSGISFLCAGVIIKVGSNIKGLTTAAGIWMTAGIGLAIGAGMYVVVGVTVLLFWFVQYALQKVPLGADSYDGYHVMIRAKNGYHFDQKLKDQLKEWDIQITDSNITWSKGGETTYDFILRRQETIDYIELKTFVTEHEEVVSFSYSPITSTHVM